MPQTKREDIIREIKDAGQYIIDNAENILGDWNRAIVSLDIVAKISPDKIATVTVRREHIVSPLMHD